MQTYGLSGNALKVIAIVASAFGVTFALKTDYPVTYRDNGIKVIHLRLVSFPISCSCQGFLDY